MSEWGSLSGILGLAFGLGLLHALDADHILTVSTLASRQSAGNKHPWKFSLQWALGHGLTLLALGGIALVIGAAFPATISRYAEATVGIMLIAIGIWVLSGIYRQRLRLGFHSHKNLPRHAHWHNAMLPVRNHDHSATLAGALHGTAGSAPILALIPVASQQSPAWGLLYLVLFSAGVLACMLLFGGLLGSAFTHLSRSGVRTLEFVRTGIAGASMAAGFYLLHGMI